LSLSHAGEPFARRVERRRVFQHNALATHPDPGLIEAWSVIGHGHHRDARELVAVDQIFEALAPVAPRLAHDALAVQVQQVEQDERHIPASPLAFGEHRLNPLDLPADFRTS
jgi:hypothetical protein